MANGNRKTLKIHWKADEKDREYIDLIPYKWFKHDVDDEDKHYPITGIRGNFLTEARCQITVSRSQAQATLYYDGKNKEYNISQEINIGTTRVTFRGESRSGVRRVEWKGERDKKFSACPVRRFWDPVRKRWVTLTWKRRLVVLATVVMLIVAVIVLWVMMKG